MKPVETPAKAQAFVDLMTKHKNNVTAVSKTTGIPETSVRRKWERCLAILGGTYKPRGQEPAAVPVTLSERAKLEDRIRSLEKELREATASIVTAEKVNSYYLGLKDQPVVEPDWVVREGKKASTTGVPVTMWSDWHYGEVVEPSQVEGANCFNLKVFDTRFRRLVENTLDLCFNHMTAANYPGIVVNLGGDLLSGNIHEELANTNEVETIPAVLDLAGKIVWGLRQFVEKFNNVLVVGVPGNHGRNTRKPQAKNACHTSFDWLVCKIVQQQLEGDKRFSFLVPNGFDAFYRVFDHRILLTHGDRIGSKGGDGFIGAIGPILRGAHKLRLSYAARGREIDTLMMGHWHHGIALSGLRVNPTLKGYDEWSMAMRFQPEHPAQDLFFIHPTRGVTCSWPIQLETPKAFDADKLGWASVGRV